MPVDKRVSIIQPGPRLVRRLMAQKVTHLFPLGLAKLEFQQALFRTHASHELVVRVVGLDHLLLIVAPR